MVNDYDSVAVSSIGFGVAIYSSHNCSASSCSLRAIKNMDQHLPSCTQNYMGCVLEKLLEDSMTISTSCVTSTSSLTYTTKGVGSCLCMLVNRHLGSLGNLVL